MQKWRRGRDSNPSSASRLSRERRRTSLIVNLLRPELRSSQTQKREGKFKSSGNRVATFDDDSRPAQKGWRKSAHVPIGVSRGESSPWRFSWWLHRGHSKQCSCSHDRRILAKV
jgi:hypothetical protein